MTVTGHIHSNRVGFGGGGERKDTSFLHTNSLYSMQFIVTNLLPKGHIVKEPENMKSRVLRIWQLGAFEVLVPIVLSQRIWFFVATIQSLIALIE